MARFWIAICALTVTVGFHDLDIDHAVSGPARPIGRQAVKHAQRADTSQRMTTWSMTAVRDRPDRLCNSRRAVTHHVRIAGHKLDAAPAQTSKLAPSFIKWRITGRREVRHQAPSSYPWPGDRTSTVR